MKQPLPSEWQDCPAGEIRRMASGLRRQQRRRTATNAVGIATILLLVGWGGGHFVKIWLQNSPPSAIACDDVKKFAPRYVQSVDGQADPLDAKTVKRIQYHLGYCVSCRQHFQQMYPQAPLPLRQPHPDRQAAGFTHSTATTTASMPVNTPIETVAKLPRGLAFTR